MKKAVAFGLGGIFLASAALTQVVGDAGNGKKLAGQCRTCHGIDGYAKIPIAPHIGGEHQPYIAAQLTAFRDGTRHHEMMTIVAKSLTDQDISDLAAWYSSQQAAATLTADEAGAPQECVACHGTNGIGVVEDVPNLAGETNIYIDTQLHAFRSGKRKHDIMNSVAAEMSDEQIRAAADWYSRIKLEIIAPK